MEASSNKDEENKKLSPSQEEIDCLNEALKILDERSLIKEIGKIQGEALDKLLEGSGDDADTD